jgi:MAF protein
VLGLESRVAPVNLDETAYLLDDPFVSALNVATAKARAVASGPDEVVLAADTLVVSEDGEVLGKPSDAQSAHRMLSMLRGQPHQVLTGVALRAPDGRQWGAVVAARVHLRRYADTEVEAYIARGEPFDKAGSYAIQDTVFQPVEHVEGCYLNVVGLPLCAVAAGLAALGVSSITCADGRPPCDLCRAGAPLVAIRSAY